jgi:hypothetical protein
MSMIAVAAVIGGGTQIIGGLIQARAANKAAAAQAAAQGDALNAQRAMFERQIELQEPFRQAGLTGQNRLMQLLGLGGDTTAADYGMAARPFGMEQFENDPGYAFRMSEGMKALERSAAARGGMLSGGALRGITRFGQDLASQEYQNAFNRYQIERQARLNPLQSLMGAGQSAANVLTGAAGTYGQQAGEAAATLGNIRASQYMGRAQALGGALQGAAGAFGDYAAMNQMQNFQNQLLNRMPQGGGGGSTFIPGSTGGGAYDWSRVGRP